MAEQTRSSSLDMVFWYNLAQREGSDGTTVLSAVVSKYWWHPKMRPPPIENSQSGLWVGDTVHIKLPDSHCTSHWTRDQATKINSKKQYQNQWYALTYS